MARAKALISPQPSRFADDYDVYIDYGKGRPVKIHNNASTFRDVEKFLIGQNRLSKTFDNKNPTMISERNLTSKHKVVAMNDYLCDSTEKFEQTLTKHFTRHSSFREYGEKNFLNRNVDKYPSTYTPNNSSRNPLWSTKETKVSYDNSWLSNKKYNTPVMAVLDRIDEKYMEKQIQLSNDNTSSCAYSYRVSKGQVIHEGLRESKIPTSLCLRIAVNGVSKSLRGPLSLSNSTLHNGDFGDDAGMIVENRDFCFLGLADGAGGNRSYGINPADFSRAILNACQNIILKTQLKPKELPRLIKTAMQQIEATNVRGSSTLCLLALDKHKHTLTSLNIGDSGFVIYRDNEIYSRSTCTMHSNGGAPKQLFSLDNSHGLSWYINEATVLHDSSLDTIKVKQDDIVILASDGFWDVIEADQLKKVVQNNKTKNLQDLANSLLQEAFDGYMVNGRDDILIIVCRIDES